MPYQQYYYSFNDTLGGSYLYSMQFLFRTIDTGRTWVEMTDSTNFFYGNIMSDCLFNKRIIGCFYETGFLGDGWGVGLSDDFGKTWRWSGKGLPLKISGFKLTTSGQSTFLGTYLAGIFESTDYGDSWYQKDSGFTSVEVWDVLPLSDSIIYAASSRRGVSVSRDSGKTWKEINNGIDAGYAYSLMQDKEGNLFMGSSEGLYLSTNMGVEWRKITVPGQYGVMRIIEHMEKIYILAYQKGIFVTEDKGKTWSKIDSWSFNKGPTAFAIDSTGRFYASQSNGAIFRSIDHGQNWMQIRQPVDSSSVPFNFAFTDNRMIFMTSYNEGVLRSTDDGLTWIKMNSGIKPQFVYYGHGITATTDGKGLFFSQMISGLYYSSDYGESWIDVAGDLKYNQITSFRYDNKGRLFLATNESVWRLDKLVITSLDENENNNLNPVSYSLSQNYPNPFNPNTIIKYSIPVSGLVTLKVYDVLGEEIKTLVNEEKAAGSYEVSFNAGYLPSGIYFYKLQAGNYTEIKKMMLVK